MKESDVIYGYDAEGNQITYTVEEFTQHLRNEIPNKKDWNTVTLQREKPRVDTSPPPSN